MCLYSCIINNKGVSIRHYLHARKGPKTYKVMTTLNTKKNVNLAAVAVKEAKVRNLEEISKKIECAKRAGKAYRVEQQGLNTFCRNLLASDNIDIRETLTGFNLVDKDAIFKFLKENALYVSAAGAICKRVAHQDCRDVKMYVEVTRWSYNLLFQAIVGNLKGRKSNVVDLAKHYTAKGVEIDSKDAQQLINSAKAAAAAQALQEEKIQSQKEKLYIEYIAAAAKE